MPKSKNRKSHGIALSRRFARGQREKIIQEKEMRKYLNRQSEVYVERYQLNDHLEQLKKLELTDSKDKNLKVIQEFVQGIKHDYTRGFFTGRLDLLGTDLITSKEFIDQLEQAIAKVVSDEENEEEE